MDICAIGWQGYTLTWHQPAPRELVQNWLYTSWSQPDNIAWLGRWMYSLSFLFRLEILSTSDRRIWYVSLSVVMDMELIEPTIKPPLLARMCQKYQRNIVQLMTCLVPRPKPKRIKSGKVYVRISRKNSPARKTSVIPCADKWAWQRNNHRRTMTHRNRHQEIPSANFDAT